MAQLYPNALLSRPIPGNEHLRFLNLRGRALDGRADVLLFTPPKVEEFSRLPLLILLHGVYGCCWNWWLNGNIDQTALEMMQAGLPPMLIAMPSDGLWGDGSGYVPHAHADYEAWIMEDVPACLGELFPQLYIERFYLAGLSMGGFGAMRLGCKYPARIAAISAHSSVTDVTQLSRFIPYETRSFLHAGERNANLLHWAQVHRGQLSPLRFDCGTEDELVEDNRRLHQALDGLGISHKYEEFPGGHNWAYWSEHVRRTLTFCASVRLD